MAKKTPMANRRHKFYRHKVHPAGNEGGLAYLPKQWRIDWDVKVGDRVVIEDRRDGTLVIVPEKLMSDSW